MSTQNDSRILVFAKLPRSGQVKTRLAVEIGADAAAELYKCFVEDLLSTLAIVPAQLQICFEPDDAREAFADWLGGQHCYLAQKGIDLGERLANAFRHTFADDAQQAVAVGSDGPDLPPRMLRQAFESLGPHDAVIGPSSDGGYYLIGFTREAFVADAFKAIAWSTDAVFQQTMAALGRNGLDVHILPTWHDVDTRSDLDALAQRNALTPFSQSKTIQLIREILSNRTV